jgi:hypothetical protein
MVPCSILGTKCHEADSFLQKPILPQPAKQSKKSPHFTEHDTFITVFNFNSLILIYRYALFAVLNGTMTVIASNKVHAIFSLVHLLNRLSLHLCLG